MHGSTAAAVDLRFTGSPRSGGHKEVQHAWRNELQSPEPKTRTMSIPVAVDCNCEVELGRALRVLEQNDIVDLRLKNVQE